jgi:hypothetical protein
MKRNYANYNESFTASGLSDDELKYVFTNGCMSDGVSVYFEDQRVAMKEWIRRKSRQHK